MVERTVAVPIGTLQEVLTALGNEGWCEICGLDIGEEGTCRASCPAAKLQEVINDAN